MMAAEGAGTAFGTAKVPGAAAPPPAISVVMPVRNAGRYLGDAVESILGQTFADFEFVVVDDGSTDGGTAVLHRLAAADRRLRVLPASGSGIVDALNQGVAAASGGLVARMDADDLAAPGRLGVQLAAFRADPALAVLGSAALAMDASGCTAGPIDVPTAQGDVAEAFGHGNPILHPTAMFRRDVFLRAGGYRAALTLAEDLDLWLRLRGEGTIRNLPEPLMRLRRHPGQVSHVRRLDQRAAAGLARFHAARPGLADLKADPPPDRALAAAMSALVRRPDLLASVAGRDWAVMLRAAWRRGLVGAATRRELAGLIARDLRPSRRLALQVDLWCKR